MYPLFKSYPQEKKDSLQQNCKENVHPKTKRREAAEYRAAHKPESAEYRATHKQEAAEYESSGRGTWRDTHRLELNLYGSKWRDARRIERRETGLVEKPESDKAIEDKALRKQVHTTAFSAPGAELGSETNHLPLMLGISK